ncbi:hypothetical protein EMIHUDRAFT_215549 [Emiliania huxleyi CCMP1516]|uniref:DUF1754-domain-containing protein n=2 Tax=Emiliania huxleyi TaxID=2903 RepID=A0A0D3IHK1_EMIH1|nr:hypothetical protein EMIHUDRAFT_249251 [Emiliania huxleyi CCMP1516]XP_005763165.1 hypothetical protein EMIHUDRAFT_215549 [Emiliania huxleyi CCMP1516]EOD08052.1 hypothetical protein EMIHUDRAFT_249251 [Emiliania huxleyi CCMP1516]EOD10736.1 hypothetical protein EMIHUDRAFT_215549 [Emiliania huxleyi CCMP1516]|eukprot:XP_005760481.1 hypothetical protein EMIHUDRAFT_249251 [Emiliania huxleyi CCMP1516]
MSDAYSNVIGGGLKLKGAGVSKKKKRKKDAVSAAASSELGDETASTSAAEGSSSTSAAEGSAAAAPPASQLPGAARFTDTERRRMEVMERRKLDEVAKGKVKSHREQVREFNDYLGSLPEHYDLPKVSKGN